MRVGSKSERRKRAAVILCLAILLLLANAGSLRAGWRMVERARGARSSTARELMLRPPRIARRRVPYEFDESCAVCYAAAQKSGSAPLLSDWWAGIHCALCRLYQGQAGPVSFSS